MVAVAPCLAQGPAMPPAELPAPDPDAQPIGYPNIKWGTLGGRQFWTDFLIQDDWRIQQNIYTGHFRLLDPKDTRWAWGNYAHCLRELHQQAPRAPQPLPEHVVILLHGLGRSRMSMHALKTAINQQAEVRAIDFAYASTRGQLSDHARALDHVLRHLEGARKISFVGHSLGNLVVRRYLDEYQTPPGITWGRMVMLGPPNQGAQIARRLKGNWFFNLVWGKSGKQLAETWSETEAHLATPEFAFGILAGGEGSSLTNPLVEGEDDLIVSVDETRLPGATDFRHIPAFHTWMPRDDQAIRLTLRFLEKGYFESPQSQQPIAPSTESSQP